MAIFRKNIFITLASSIMFRISFYVKYDNIMDKFECEHSKAKAKVSVAVV